MPIFGGAAGDGYAPGANPRSNPKMDVFGTGNDDDASRIGGDDFGVFKEFKLNDGNTNGVSSAPDDHGDGDDSDSDLLDMEGWNNVTTMSTGKRTQKRGRRTEMITSTARTKTPP